MFTWVVRVSDLFLSRFILRRGEVCVSVFLPLMKHRDLRELSVATLYVCDVTEVLLVASAPHRDWVGGEKLSPERGGSCSGVRRFAI